MALRPSGRTRARTHSRDSAPWKVWAVVLAVAIIVVSGTLIYRKGIQERVVTDTRTLCPDASRISAVTVVLLDISDALTPAQTLDIQNRLRGLLMEVPRHGLIQVFSARAGSGAIPNADLEICNPGSEADVNALYQNPRMAKDKWTSFSERLQEGVAEELRQPSSTSSPIFEAIQAAGLRTFGNPDLQRQHRRLIIVSDLMQNMPGGLSMYSGVPPFADFKSGRYYNSVKTSLGNVVVVVLYLVRVPKQPWPQHPDFWSGYFADQGAHLISLVPIHGAN